MPDTIVAIATPPQNSAIGIIRLSGPKSLAVLKAMFRGLDGSARTAFSPRRFYTGKLVSQTAEAMDEIMAVFFAAPASYTGEDVVELYCHGNVLLLRRILHEVLNLPPTEVRAADPGEFTKRAFLNGKMDLSEAEAVHALISAGSTAAIRASLGNLDGALARRVAVLREHLLIATAQIEAGFEFAEENVQTYDRFQLQSLLNMALAQLCELISAYQTAKLYDHGMSVALVGRPNVGKSSLLNAILIEDRAIVTAIPGTTRDVVEGHKILGGIRFIFRDTAGLRDGVDVVEEAGMARAHEWIVRSDIVLWISDNPGDPGHAVDTNLVTATPHIINVLNKCDLTANLKSFTASDLRRRYDYIVSAKTGEGLDELQSALVALANVSSGADISINPRQFAKLSCAKAALASLVEAGLNHLGDEIIVEELRTAAQALAEITGEITNDEVLGEIFSKFCIGK